MRCHFGRFRHQHGVHVLDARARVREQRRDAREQQQARSVLPLGIVRILEIGSAQNALRVFKAGGFQHAGDRGRNVGHDVHGIPLQLADPLDRLRGEFRRADIDEDIGVAVAVDDGLLVPVVRFADGKTLTQIGTEVRNYVVKAREKKLQPSDWEGNTFTISNLGMFGIDEFTAIINTPDSCILAVGGIKQTPVVKNGQIVPGNVMKVTLSCDHRTVDGAVGSAFLQTLKHNLENPVLMLGANSI